MTVPLSPPTNGPSPKEAYAADLRAQIQRLQALLIAVESEGGTLVDPSTVRSSAEPAHKLAGEPVRPDSFFGMSVPQATKKFLQMKGKGNPQSVPGIVDALIEGGLEKAEKREQILKNIYTAFARTDDFIKVSGRLWGLKEWYGDRAVAKQEAPAAKKKARKRSGKKRPTNANSAAKKPSASQTALKLEPTGPISMGWRAFLAKAIEEGKTMQQAGAEWRARKQG